MGGRGHVPSARLSGRRGGFCAVSAASAARCAAKPSGDQTWKKRPLPTKATCSPSPAWVTKSSGRPMRPSEFPLEGAGGLEDLGRQVVGVAGEEVVGAETAFGQGLENVGAHAFQRLRGEGGKQDDLGGAGLGQGRAERSRNGNPPLAIHLIDVGPVEDQHRTRPLMSLCWHRRPIGHTGPPSAGLAWDIMG